MTGRFNLYAEMPTFSNTTKGPTHLSASLALGCSVLRFSASSQMRVPFIYSFVFVFIISGFHVLDGFGKHFFCFLYCLSANQSIPSPCLICFADVFCKFSVKSLAAEAWVSFGMVMSPIQG